MTLPADITYRDGSTPAEQERPLISVVIACVNGTPFILDCLDHLTRQEGDVSYELIVVDCCGSAVREAIRHRFRQPEVVLIEVAGRASVPRLRAIGMQRATGRLIAILEDHCNVVPHWMQSLAAAHAAGHQAIGGAVENGSCARLTDWAVYFCEYVRFMPPLECGVVDEITGNNSAYDGDLLARLGSEVYDEVWESFIHRRIRELGVPFYCEPAMLVYHKKEFGFFYFLSQRFHYSRSFAGMRVAASPIWKRLAYAGATPLLPPLLLVRMTRTLLAKKRRISTFVKALPIIGVFLMSWAWGETVGALFGQGDSLARVE